MKEPAHVLYDAYGESAAWKNYRGDLIPTWSILAERLKKHWRATAACAEEHFAAQPPPADKPGDWRVLLYKWTEMLRAAQSPEQAYEARKRVTDDIEAVIREERDSSIRYDPSSVFYGLRVINRIERQVQEQASIDDPTHRAQQAVRHAFDYLRSHLGEMCIEYTTVAVEIGQPFTPPDQGDGRPWSLRSVHPALHLNGGEPGLALVWTRGGMDVC